MKIVRILGIVIAAIAMVGFGLCGLLGVVVGAEPANMGDWFNIFSFLGLACLAACGGLAWFLAKILRKAQKPPGQ